MRTRSRNEFFQMTISFRIYFFYASVAARRFADRHEIQSFVPYFAVLLSMAHFPRANFFF